jgi:uncharacterized RDD family membrane protein YckC
VSGAPGRAALPAFAGARLAGWWSRVGAAVVDGLILTVPIVVIAGFVVAVAARSQVGAVLLGMAGLVAYLFARLFYAPALMARQGAGNGQTWGKQIIGIRVVRDGGQPFDLGYGFLREFVVKYLLFGVVGSLFLWIPTILDYLWPLWEDQNRCLHDMVVSTHVVAA